MEQKDKQINNFFCISLVYNPLTDEVPEVFHARNKESKEQLTHDILRNDSSQFYKNIILLKTCQRVELYIQTDHDIEYLRAKFTDIYRKYFGDKFYERLKIYAGVDAKKHVIRLATGLESFINGEAEIYDQISKLYKKYYEDGLAGEYLNQIFCESLKIATDARKSVTGEKGIKSYPEISFEFLESKNINPNKILILGEGLLSESMRNFWDKKGVYVEVSSKASGLNLQNIDVVINCSSKTKIHILNDLDHQTFLDFSVPPLIEANSNNKEYFAVTDFKVIIERNNRLIKPFISKLGDYIDSAI